MYKPWCGRTLSFLWVLGTEFCSPCPQFRVEAPAASVTVFGDWALKRSLRTNEAGRVRTGVLGRRGRDTRSRGATARRHCLQVKESVLTGKRRSRHLELRLPASGTEDATSFEPPVCGALSRHPQLTTTRDKSQHWSVWIVCGWCVLNL